MNRRANLGLAPRLLLPIAAAMALTLSLIELLDYFEIPIVETATQHALTSSSASVFTGLVFAMAKMGYLGVFALMALESASLPIPSEVVLPLAGYLVYVGSMDFAWAVAVCTLAGMVGALADYYVALKLGRPAMIHLAARLGIRTGQLERAERWIGSKGALLVLLARFTPGLRSAISLPAGALRMNLGSFLATTFAGSLGWSLLLIYLGFQAGPLWQTALARSSGVLSMIILGLIAALSSAYLVHVAFSYQRRKGSRSRL